MKDDLGAEMMHHIGMNDLLERNLDEYWEQQNTVSIIDKNLHKIEIDSVIQNLRPTDCVLDIGCGDGKATNEYSKKVKEITAIEKSEYLRNKAAELINVQVGDVMDLGYKNKFDVIISQRMLINLMSFEDQKKAIANIHKALKPNGRFIMIENTDNCFKQLNHLRGKVSLEPIPKHWHNLFFDREKLFAFMDNKFKLKREYDYSLYYLLTRVYTQMFASFKGYGVNAVKDDVFSKSDDAARITYELFKDDIKIDPKISTIQCFVWEKADGVF